MTAARIEPVSNAIDRTSGLVIKLVMVALALKIVTLFALALNTRFVMDEFWQFHQAYYVFNGIFETIWPEKTVFYVAVFKIAGVLGNDAVSELLIARVLSAGLATLLVGVVYLTSRTLGHTRFQALLVAVLLLSFSTFIERSFRLRSEPVAILFAATAVWVVVRAPADRVRTLLIAGFLSGLAFVSTQKSVYFNVALGAGLVIDALASLNIRSALVRSALLILGWIAAVVSYAVMFGGGDALRVLQLTFFGPLEVATTAQSYYADLRVYLYQTLSRNALLYLLCFCGVGLQAVRFMKLRSGDRIHLVATLVMALLVFTHNQPWPYVFTMVLPFLAPYAMIVYRRLSEVSARANVLLLVFAALITISCVRNVQYFDHDNRAQLSVVRMAESLTGQDDTYFDGIGMLPNRTMQPYSWLDAMWVHKTREAGADSDLMRGLEQHYPAVIIQSYRTKALAELLEPLIAQSYVAVGNNILVPGRRLDADQTQVLNVLQTKTFTAINSATGAPLDSITVDGESRPVPLRLPAGEYSLTSPEGVPVWFVPEGSPLKPTTAPTEQEALFERVYSF
ncbi:glycosyltransferase family 39 protein [Aliiroseovarius sp. YM-037]|uniref:DUF7056 domain-containing protein n=1 Tax=Aliiroseovarius sp. YM-037 TaxID=3341728 RepID=UPI003A80EEA9